MKSKTFFKIGFIVCAVLLFGGGGIFYIYHFTCPLEPSPLAPTPIHTVEIESHGKYLYITPVQYILVASMMCTGGLGIIVLGITQVVLKKRNNKLKPDRIIRDSHLFL